MHQYWRPGWPRHRIVQAVVVVAVAAGALLPWDRSPFAAWVMANGWCWPILGLAAFGCGWAVLRLSADREFTAIAAAFLTLWTLYSGPVWWTVAGWVFVLWLSVVSPKEHRVDEIKVPDHGTVRPTNAERTAYWKRQGEQGRKNGGAEDR